jgi:thioredoxin 1
MKHLDPTELIDIIWPELSKRSFIPVLVEFWSPVCNVCEKAEKYLEKLEQAYKDKIIVVKVNVNDDLQLLELYNIRRIPTFVLFRNSLELARVVGFKSDDEIEKTIRNIIK